MKIPLKWLKDYVNVTLTAAEIAEKLTMAGNEVKGIITVGGKWENIVIGQITAINPHPNADRLLLPTVDLGTSQQTVVCGAPNLKIGDKIAFAREGAELIDPRSGQPIRLTSAKIRGVISSGMVCSEKELGISDSHEGIMVLPPDAPVGTPLADYLGDTVLDLDVTPNRPDCLSVIGIAREVAALTGQGLRLHEVSYPEEGLPIDRQITVEIIDPDLCPRYCATLITGIKIAESPPWMQERLLACGMRPINNVVDVTNYVMLEYGQPLHSFDYDRIKGKKIIVRRAAAGETIVSLDGTERTLANDMLVIADEARAVAIAGVMGGANSEVTENTTSILLESANFNSASIHYTARNLTLNSEASMRFERGIRPGLTVPAIKHATQLMMQLAGGKAAGGMADIYPGKQDTRPVVVSAKETERLLGVEFGAEQIKGILTSLGFGCEATGSPGELLVTAPYWRSDISQPVDLIEEVARISGYDKIPVTLLGQPLPPQNPESVISLDRKIRECLKGYGFQEVITYSLTSSEMLNRLLPEPETSGVVSLRLMNPMTADLEYLRTSLRANILAVLAANRRHEDGSIRLYELSKVYLRRDKELPDEPEALCGVLNGARADNSWLEGKEPLDFFDAKGVVEGLLDRLGITARFEPGNDSSLHPSRQAAIVIGGETLGVVGELHPQVSSAFEFSGAVYLFELKATALLPFTTGQKLFQPIPRFPSIVRDLALIVDTQITHQQVGDIISSLPLVSQVSLFDVYSGQQVAPGKKSFAYRITYQSPTHTLTDEEVNQVQQQVLEKLSEQVGATLRS